MAIAHGVTDVMAMEVITSVLRGTDDLERRRPPAARGCRCWLLRRTLGSAGDCRWCPCWSRRRCRRPRRKPRLLGSVGDPPVRFAATSASKPNSGTVDTAADVDSVPMSCGAESRASRLAGCRRSTSKGEKRYHAARHVVSHLMRGVSRARRLVVPVALSAVVAACGSGTAPTKSPSDQLKAAAAAFGAASSFHLKGSIDHGGTPYTFDVGVRRPDSANGSVTLSNGQTAQFMVAGGAAFTHGPGVAVLLDAVSKRVAGDRWVLLHNPGWQTALVKVAGSDNFVANFVSNQPGLVASSATVAGQKALKISNSVESIFVAATGPPVVLRIER